jgi:periplasmic divalent cation tolerance protein
MKRKVPMSEFIQVSTTIDDRDKAQRIAEALIERKLAACVQVAGPVTSTYRWQGRIERTEEWVCLIKTRAERYADVEAAIRVLHPYEVPEIVATEIVAGNDAYLKWLTENIE